MLNSEAFISEIKANGNGESAANEFVEITISKSADLSDYTLSFYHSATGLLEPGYSGSSPSPGSSFFPGEGEFTLADVANQTGTLANPAGSVASGIGGLDLQIVEHPDDASYWVILVPFSGAGLDGNLASVGTVALTNTAVDESEAYNIDGGSTAPLVDGAAAGTPQVATSSTGTLIDGYGNITSGTPTPGDSVLCFDAHVEIDVPGGTRAAGDLRVGDNVICSDGQSRPVRWVGLSKVSRDALVHNPKLRPVRILSGALGNGLPRSDLLVSRQHRIATRSTIAERMFGEPEVLVAAIRLAELPGIFVDDSVDNITYVHLLFDQHEMVFANGALAESLFNGPEAKRLTGPEVWKEMEEMFSGADFSDRGGKPARYIPQRKQQMRLIERHRKNGRPLFSEAVSHSGRSKHRSVLDVPAGVSGLAKSYGETDRDECLLS